MAEKRAGGERVRLQEEVDALLSWEQDSKIKVSPNISLIGSSSQSILQLEIFGSITSNGGPIILT